MPAFFCSIQFVKPSSVLLARAFSQKTRNLLVEQALLSLFNKKLPEWLLFDFLTLTLTADKDNPHLHLPPLTCAFGCAEAKQIAIPLADS